MAAALPAAGPPATATQVVLPGLPTWEELFAAVDRVFTLPVVPYCTMLSAAIFNLADPPETL